MNVQINPLQTPPTQDDDLDEHVGHTRTYVIGGVALALVLGGFWYFTHDSGAPKAKRNLAAPVKVAPVEIHDMAVIEHTIGTVMANSTVQVNARVNGQLTKAFFKEGQMVKTGDPLFEIDPRPYQAAYDNALATLATSKAKADRYQKLLAQNAISPQDEEDAQAAYLVAKSNAEAARLNLEFTHIRSPVDGKTGAAMVQTGNMVSATAMTPLVTIDQIHPIKVAFALPQTDLPLIQARQRGDGLTATVVSQGVGGKPLAAPVDFINNAVNNVTGTIELRATFKNEDNVLVPGQLLNVSVQLDDIPGGLVVPHEAINIGPDGNYVFALKGAKVVQKPVTVLFDDGKSTAVKGDLAPGESVVTDGQLRLVPGATVLVEGARPARTPGVRRGGRKRPAEN